MMAHDPDEDRIRRKAHELWEAEGQPHGRDADHWEQAREIIALQDSQQSTLLPRDSGVDEPVESRELQSSFGDIPNLTDQGDNALTDVSREPAALSTPPMTAMTSGDIKGQAAAAVKNAPKPTGASGKAPPSKAPTPRSDASKASKPGSAKTK